MDMLTKMTGSYDVDNSVKALSKTPANTNCLQIRSDARASLATNSNTTATTSALGERRMFPNQWKGTVIERIRDRMQSLANLNATY